MPKSRGEAHEDVRAPGTKFELRALERERTREQVPDRDSPETEALRRAGSFTPFSGRGVKVKDCGGEHSHSVVLPGTRFRATQNMRSSPSMAVPAFERLGP